MIGGLGLAPGANFGEGIAIFEPTHGSAPKYTGQNKVNPMAQMLSGMLMLRHLGEDDAADRLEAAIAEVIREGESVTYDMKPTPRRPDRRRHERGRRRAHRQAGGARCVGRSPSSAPGTSARPARRCSRQRDYADVVLVDIKEGLPQGKALDINQMGAVLGYEPSVIGSNAYDETAGSEVVVITAGLPRQPGMSRDDLVTTNEKIVGSVTEQVVAREPGRDPDRRLEPARRDVPRREERLRLAEGARLRDGGHPRHGALLDLHRLGDGRRRSRT